jgi:hypothetical protein
MVSPWLWPTSFARNGGRLVDEEEIRVAVREKWGETVEDFASEWSLPVQDALYQLAFDVDPHSQGDEVVIFEEE